MIYDVWKETIHGCPMFVLSQKLKMLKLKLKEWSKTVFGNVHSNVTNALAKVDKIQNQMTQLGYSDILQVQEKEAQIQLQNALCCEVEFWKEESRMNWHAFGDRNTEVFHKTAKIRHVTKQISFLKHGEQILHKPNEIEEHILNHYKAIFASDKMCQQNDLVDKVIPKLVSNEDNAMLSMLPYMEEVRNRFQHECHWCPGS